MTPEEIAEKYPRELIELVIKLKTIEVEDEQRNRR